MAFSGEVKKELCRSELSDGDTARSELYGILLFGRSFCHNKITFTTESRETADRAAGLLQRLYMPIVETQTALRSKTGGDRLYKVRLIDPGDCERIFDDMGHSARDISLRVNRANLSSEEQTAAFLRGVFLSCGAVSDPMKGYHAEFCVPHKNLSSDLVKLLKEVTETVLTPKTTTRGGAYLVYFKGSEQICDLLAYLGAPISAMEIMGAKAVKQVRNVANRRRNSEVANITKIVSASVKQVRAIELIQKKRGLESLPPELKEIALLRLENPDMSLRALGENLDPPISRSGANHRVQRLMEYAEGLEDKDERKL